MRTVWIGYLTISMVTIPIRMYNARTRKDSLNFHLLHEKCNSRVKQQYICPQCREVVSREDMTRGYQYGKDMYVEVTDEEMQAAQKESTEDIEVLKFVDEGEVSPLFYSSADPQLLVNTVFLGRSRAYFPKRLSPLLSHQTSVRKDLDWLGNLRT